MRTYKELREIFPTLDQHSMSYMTEEEYQLYSKEYIKEQQTMHTARMKAKAIEMMEKLEIYKPYINAFKSKKQTITMYEEYVGFYIDTKSKLYKDIKAFEEKYNCIVFAVTHEITDFGELYDYIYIPKYENEWEDTIQMTQHPHAYNVHGYVQNITIPEFSEFGCFGIGALFGGLTRLY